MLFILLIYLLFGLGNGCLITDGIKERFAWETSAILVILGVNLVAVFLAWLLARTSKLGADGNYKYGLSPIAWRVGLAISYLVGFIAGIIVA
jgi:hypothetical protein